MMARMGKPAGHLLALHLKQWRSALVLVLLMLWLATLAGRAAYLQGLRYAFLQRKGDAFSDRVIELPAHRGMIFDRNGEPLAISTPVESLWRNPSDVEATAGQIRQLAGILQMTPAEIRARTDDRSNHDFVYIKRRLPPDQAEAVTGLDIQGLSLQREYRRYYPAGESVAALLGITGVDDNGEEGIELGWQGWLGGKPGSRRVLVDRHGNIVEDVKSILSPRPGRDLQLSVDMRLQYLALRELQAAVAVNKARAGEIVVLDARSGEVLALANVPSFNPNNLDGAKPWTMRNRVMTDQYEPGSTLKPFTVTSALDAGKITPDTVIDTEGGYWEVSGRRIHDAHPEGLLTVGQVIEKSSNVGASKIALSLPPEYMWQKLHDSGFGTAPATGFPGSASGDLRPWQHWRPIEQATMSYGNGVSVSLLQLARGYTIFANHGVLLPVSLLKSDGTPPAGTRVFSARAADDMAAMLQNVVTPDGTAPQASLPDYTVAGKTGTAHKPDHGGYSPNRYIASFVGFAPASQPRLIVAVMIDEPSAGSYYGGSVAGPVFHAVMEGALHLLDVAPDRAPPVPPASPEGLRQHAVRRVPGKGDAA